MVNKLELYTTVAAMAKRRHRGGEGAEAHQVTLVGPPRPRAVVALGKVAYAHRCEPGAGRRAGLALGRGGRDPPPARARRAYANPRKRTSGCNSMPYASYTFDLAMLMSSNTSER